jgi:hypothetical protein
MIQEKVSRQGAEKNMVNHEGHEEKKRVIMATENNYSADKSR